MSDVGSGLLDTTEGAVADNDFDPLIQRVAESSEFSRADTLRRLLLYLWANRNQNISEYAIGVDVLGRRSDFEPKLDAAVRVQISRLRIKLKKFYETEGADDPRQISIPLGGHRLTVVSDLSDSGVKVSQSPEVPGLPVPETRVARYDWIRLGMLLTCLLLVACCAELSWELHLKAALEHSNLSPTKFWSTFINGVVPVKLILPTPVFFTVLGSGSHVRDIDVNDYRDWNKSALIRSLTKGGSGLGLDHSYTVTSDTLAAVDLERYLDSVGLGKQVAFEVTGDSALNNLEDSSIIALGAHSTLQPFHDYLNSMNFVMGPQEGWVDNRRPAMGEQSRYTASDQGDGRTIEFGIIAVLPNRGRSCKILIMQARHTSALVAMLTSETGNALFNKLYAAHGSPKFFEVVVENEMHDDHVMRSRPLVIHSYPNDPPQVSQ